MIISKTISAAIKNGIRSLTVMVNGKSDARTAQDAAPYGTDAPPIAGMQALYVKSTISGKAVYLGCINTQMLAEAGEHRIYSTNADGNLQTYVWLKGNGDILLGGNTNHLTQYEALNTHQQSMINKINAQLTLIQTAISSLGGAYAKVDVSEDFSSAKTNKIKTT